MSTRSVNPHSSDSQPARPVPPPPPQPPIDRTPLGMFRINEKSRRPNEYINFIEVLPASPVREALALKLLEALAALFRGQSPALARRSATPVVGAD